MKLIDLSLYLVYISTYFIIVPLIVGLYYYKTLSASIKILLLRICLIFSLDFSLLFIDLKVVTSFFYFYTIIDLVMISWMYYIEFKKSRFSKSLFVLCIIFLLFIAIDALYISGLANKGISNGIIKIYFLFLALYYLTDLFHYKIEIYLATYPVFWVSIGIIVVNLIGSFDVFSKAVLSFSQSLYLQFYSIWSIAAILAYSLYAYAFKLSNKHKIDYQ